MTPVEHVARLEPLIRTMAAERVPSALRDDAEQEARIAVWKVAQRHEKDPRALAGLLTVVARRAVTAVATGKPMTGEQSRQGLTRDVLRSRTALPFDPNDADDPRAEDHAAETDLRADVARVLACLKPWERRYVVARFLEDRPVTEVAAELGMSPTGLANAWSRRLRPLLAEALAPLVVTV